MAGYATINTPLVCFFAQRHLSSPYSAKPIQRLRAQQATMATLGGTGEVLESEADRVGINLLWIVAPICAMIVFVLLLALIVVVAIR